jgi:hypothetical protein
VINAIPVVDHFVMRMFHIAKLIVLTGPFVADFVPFLDTLTVRSFPPALDRGLRVVPKM